MRDCYNIDEESYEKQESSETHGDESRWLYRSESTAGRGVEDDRTSWDFDGGRLSVLLAVDDRRLCDSLAALLRVADYNVANVYSGIEVVAAVNNGEFDAAVIGMDLPDMDGAEVLKEVRRADPDLGTLALAEAASLECASESLDLNADAFVALPADPDIILWRLWKVARIKGLERRLRESEARYRELVEEIDEGIFRTDLEGNYTMINQAGTEILGFERPEEVVGDGLWAWGTFFSQCEQEALRTKALREGEVRAEPVRFRRRDGTAGWLETTVRTVRDWGGAVVGFEGVFREISDRVRRQETLEALQALWADLGEVESLKEIGRLALDFLRGVIGFEKVSFAVVNKLLSTKITSKPLDEGQGPSLEERAIISRAIRTGEVQIVPDAWDDECRSPYLFDDGEDALSMLAVPVKLGGEVVAVIEVGSTKSSGLQDEERKLVELVADHVASAIDRLVLSKLGPRPDVRLNDFL